VWKSNFAVKDCNLGILAKRSQQAHVWGRKMDTGLPKYNANGRAAYSTSRDKAGKLLVDPLAAAYICASAKAIVIRFYYCVFRQ
jgi:hypothetical protein